MGRGFEFLIFYFCCVAFGLIFGGLYLIIKRFVLRRNGTPVMIVSILPRVIKELPLVRGMDKYIYGYDIKYILNGETHTAESVEFYIPFGPIGGPVVLFSPTGVLAKNGEVSIDNVRVTIVYGLASIALGIWVFLAMLRLV
jgi:hypothetical protein